MYSECWKRTVPSGMLQDYSMEFTTLNVFNNDTKKNLPDANILKLKNSSNLKY